MFIDPTTFDAWAVGWRARLVEEPRDTGIRRAAMEAVNPAFIRCNHRGEAMIVAAAKRGSFGPFETMLELLSRPYQDQPDFVEFAGPPEAHERVLATFCGP